MGRVGRLPQHSETEDSLAGKELSSAYRVKGILAILLKANLFSTPGVPASLEGFKEFFHDGPLKKDPCITPAPASPPEVKTTVLIGDIESARKGLSEVDHDELSVIAMNIMKGRCPFKGVGRPYLNPCPGHVSPKTSGSSYGAEVVMQEIDLYPFPALLF